MSPAPGLRWLAADAEDLAIISAAAQDGVFRVADVDWRPKAGRFTLRIQRYRWEENAAQGKGERVDAVLSFDQVQAARALRLRAGQPDAVGSLLAIRFEAAGEPPEGRILLDLAGGGAFALDVACIDTVLADLGAPRPAVGRPAHGD